VQFLKKKRHFQQLGLGNGSMNGAMNPTRCWERCKLFGHPKVYSDEDSDLVQVAELLEARRSTMARTPDSLQGDAALTLADMPKIIQMLEKQNRLDNQKMLNTTAQTQHQTKQQQQQQSGLGDIVLHALNDDVELETSDGLEAAIVI